MRCTLSSPVSAKIFSISDDDAIRRSRELLLQSAGYSVVSLPSYFTLDEKIPHAFDIAIIGQTVDDATASRIADQLRRAQSNIRIVRLTQQYTRPATGFDRVCFSEDGPAILLSYIAELVTRGGQLQREKPASTETKEPIKASEAESA